MKVFISHKSDDKIDANEIYKALRRIGGVDAWVDIFELNAGDSLGKIESSVGASDAMIVLWSSSTDASEWVRKEIDTGKRNDKRIIPCILDRSLPASNPTLADRLYIDLSDRLLGMSHLCVSYILPTALTQAGLADQLGVLRRYEGYVSHSIRDIIVGRKRIEDAAYWANESNDAFAEMGSWLDALIEDERTDEDLRQVLLGASDIVVPAHERLLDVLAEIAEEGSEVSDGDDDPSIAEIIEAYDPDEGYREIVGFVLRLLQEGGVDLDEVPDDDIDQAANLLNYYLKTCVGSLAALEYFADVTESAAARTVVEYLDTYLEDTDDVLPEDEHGYAGLLDDAWMIHNVAYRVHEAGLVTDDYFDVDWQLIADADTALIELLPSDIVDELERYLVQLVGILFADVDDYDPEGVYDSDGNLRFLMPTEV